MHHPPHFPPLPRLSPSNKKRADVKQRFNTPKGSISLKHTAHSLLFPPFSHLHISVPYFPFPFSSDHARSPLFPPISSFPAIFSFAHFRPLLPVSLFIRPRPSPLFPPFSHLHTSAPLTSRFPFHHTTPTPFFFRQSPPFPSSFSQLSLTFPLFCSFFFSIHSFPTLKIKKIHISAKKT